MKIKWLDTTSYSQSDKERKPAWWETKVGRIRVSVGNVYRGEKGWFMHCDPWFDTFEIKAKDEIDAKEKALHRVKKILMDALKDLD